MSSISILETRLTEIEGYMDTRAEVIETMSSTITAQIEERDHKQKLYNELDEESIELKEAIELLKKAKELHD